MSQPPDISLHLDFPKIFIAGAGSRFTARVVNLSDRPLEDVVVTFACADFEKAEFTAELDGIAPGSSQEATVAVEPARVSNRPLICTLECLQGAERRTLCGVWEGLNIFERPSSQVSITNIVQDIQSHRGSEKAGFGAVNGDVNINLTSNLGQVHTLNDLLRITLPPAWQEVPLRVPGTTFIRFTADRRRIPPVFLRVYEPMQALHIRPVAAPALAAADPTPRGWRLKGGASSQLVLGRSSADADLVTRFMPADPANDSKSAGLSRKQARLSVNASGLLQVENISSGNVVIAGRSAVAVGAFSPLSSDQMLSLGTPPADLRLNFTLTQPADHFLKVTNLEDWQGFGATRHLPTESNPSWGHAQVSWLNTSPSYWHTLWFSRVIAFGRGEDVPLNIKEDALDPCHGFIHCFSGCYWLEVISSRGGVSLEDPQNPDSPSAQPVPPGVIIPLRSHMILTFGTQSFRLSKAS